MKMQRREEEKEASRLVYHVKKQKHEQINAKDEMWEEETEEIQMQK